MSTNISGYTGNFKQPITNLSLYGPTIYGVSDLNKRELNLILLTPESYYDAYKIIKQIGFVDIKLFIPALDVLFVSDLFNLIMETFAYKPSIQWIFPKTPVIATSTTFEQTQIQTSFYINQIDSNITIEYVSAGIVDRDVYDVIVKDGEKTRYFCQYITLEKLELLYALGTIDEVHLSYDSTLYGGLTYMDAIAKSKKFKTKLIANSFGSISAYEYAKSNNVNMGKFISSAFNLSGIRGVVDYIPESIL